jgi:AcrR family transcriptional regulator
MDTESHPPHRPRDKAATRKRLIDAVGRVLAQKGFSALGINHVAREAGVDKVLIYRYFGGLAELMDVYGREGDFWPNVDELTQGVESESTPAEAAGRVVANYLSAIRNRPVTLEILAWEVTVRNELTIRLEKTREQTSRELTHRLASLEAFSDARGVDIEAFGALFSSAFTYLLVRSFRGTTVYNGIEIGKPLGWERLERAINRLIVGYFSAFPNASAREKGEES